MAGRLAGGLFGLLAVLATAVVPVHAGASESGWVDTDTGIQPHAVTSATRPDAVLFDGRPRIGYVTGDHAVAYAWCDSACDTTESWERTVVHTTSDPHEGDTGWPSAHSRVNLRVDSDGRPHLAWMDDKDNTIRYATCASSCEDASSWSVTTVARVDTGCDSCGSDGGITIKVAIPVALALDVDGRPAIAHTSGSDPKLLYYARCERDCSDPDGWERVLLESSDDTGYKATLERNLVFDGTKPRLLFGRLKQDDPLLLRSCDAACLDAGSWHTTALEGTEEHNYTSDLAFTGGPAAIGYTIQRSTGGRSHPDYWFAFVSCQDDCLDPERWASPVVFDDVGDNFAATDTATQRVGDRYYHGAGSPSVVLDDGPPRFAYSSCIDCGTDDEERRLFFGACDGACDHRESWTLERLSLDDTDAASPRLLGDGTRLHLLYHAYEDDESDGSHRSNGTFHYARCEQDCADVPEPATTTTTESSSTTTTSSSTTTTSSSSTTTTTAPESSPDSPTTPTLGHPEHGGSHRFGQPSSFEATADSPEGHPYKLVVVVRDVDTGRVVADFESSFTGSGLTAAGSPDDPIPRGTYEWTARAVDTLGRSSPYAAPARFTVGGG